MATLVLPRQLHFRSLLNEIGRQLPVGGVPETIDLGRVEWVHPSGLAALAAFVARAREHHEVAWRHADLGACRAFRYFQDMDFFRQFGLFEAENFSRRDETLAFARLVQVNWQADSTQVAKNLAKLVLQHAKPLHYEFFVCIEESIRNVIDHARRPGFAVAQARQERGGDRSYNVAICDFGRGVLAGLNDNPDLRVTGHAEALDVACRKGTSGAIAAFGPGEIQMNFGAGLFQIDRIAESTHGRFILGSGGAVRICDAGGVRFEAVPYWQGTSVEITLYLSGFRDVLQSRRSSGRL